MDTFWINLKLVSKDYSYLNRSTYASMYSELYKYIVEESKNKKTAIYNLNYYDYIIENTNKIILDSLYDISIDSLLKYNETFYEYSEFVSKLNNVYEYFNKQVTIYNKHIFTISTKTNFTDNAISIWYKYIFNNPDSYEIIENTILNNNLDMRKQYFETEDIDDENKFINLFEVQDFLNNCEDKYKDSIINNVNEIIVDYYNNYFKSNYQKIDSKFINKIKIMIHLEDEIFCFTSIIIDIAPIIEKLLLSRIDIIYKTIYSSITQSDIDCFNTLYNFLTPELNDIIVNIYNKYLEVHKNIFTILDSPESIVNFCKFYKIANTLLVESFSNDTILKKMLEDLVSNLLNKTPYFSDQYGNYFNKLIISNKIEEFHILILKHLNNSEAFQVQIVSNIKKHILRNYNTLSDNFIDTVKNIISVIKDFEGIDITFKLKKILEDIDNSNKLKPLLNYGSEFNMLIAADGIWNINSKPITFNDSNKVNKLPKKLGEFNEKVKEIYNVVYEGRKLKLCDNFYTNEIEFPINNKIYTIFAPLNITLILLYFNENEKLPQKIITEEELNIDPILTYKILKKVEDYYIINDKFKYKYKTISLFSKSKKKKIKKEIIYDHNILLQTHIIKVLKQEKEINETKLFELVSEKLKKKIKFTSEEYNKVLKKLEKDDYLNISPKSITYIP